MRHVLQSSRLQLRPLQLSDAPFVLELFNSPGWIKYIGDRGVHTVQDAEIFLSTNALRSFRLHGWGSYLISLKESELAIGTVGIHQKPALEHPDLGYALLPAYEGHGYATEAAETYLTALDQAVAIETLLAVSVPENLASHRVLQKLGFEAAGKVEMDQTLLCFSRKQPKTV